MFIRAGALSLALLLASRLLGVFRESAQAAAFGTSGLADIAVLMLALPDWVASVFAAGALSYVLLPVWAGQPSGAVEQLQRPVTRGLLLLGAMLGLVLLTAPLPAARWLAGGLPVSLQPLAAKGLMWSALAIPAALLAALWSTRLQHERDFVGLYGGNIVVNLVLVAALALVAVDLTGRAIPVLGMGLLFAMALRLTWLHLRQPSETRVATEIALVPFPSLAIWSWALIAAGLPLALPFVARSVASHAGEGALATFNYAWKLVELPLVLAIQLVAALALPAIARVLASSCVDHAARVPIRQAFALAWMLACAAVAGLMMGAPAVAQLLFGWGSMPILALEQVAHWGRAGSWGLLPQAIAAVAVAVLAARRRMRAVVFAYFAALMLLVGAAAWGVQDGWQLMHVLNVGYALVAITCIVALGPQGRDWLPWSSIACASGSLGIVALLAWSLAETIDSAGLLAGLMAAAAGAVAVIGFTLLCSDELRNSLRR